MSPSLKTFSQHISSTTIFDPVPSSSLFPNLNPDSLRKQYNNPTSPQHPLEKSESTPSTHAPNPLITFPYVPHRFLQPNTLIPSCGSSSFLSSSKVHFISYTTSNHIKTETEKRGFWIQNKHLHIIWTSHWPIRSTRRMARTQLHRSAFLALVRKKPAVEFRTGSFSMDQTHTHIFFFTWRTIDHTYYE